MINVIDEYEGITTLQVESQYVGQLIQYLDSLVCDQQMLVQDLGFQRRVIPYFLNQFMLWCRDEGYDSCFQHLMNLKSSKSTNQKKFELGNLQSLFKQENRKQKALYQEIRELWSLFLQGPAQERIRDSRKIKNENQKVKYLDSIKRLRAELSKSKPYERFLSRSQCKKNNDTFDQIIVTKQDNY